MHQNNSVPEKIFKTLMTFGISQFDGTDKAVGSIEAKAGFMVAGNIAVLVLLATAIDSINIFILLGLLVNFASLILSAFALRSKVFQNGVKIKKTYDDYKGQDISSFYNKVIETVDSGLNANSTGLASKGRHFNESLVLFIIGTFLLTTGLLISVYLKQYDTQMQGEEETPQATIEPTETPTPTPDPESSGSANTDDGYGYSYVKGSLKKN